MHNAERYPFIAADSTLGEAGLQPYLPFTLTYQDRSVTVSGLLNTGAMVNVLPYQVGVDLGAGLGAASNCAAADRQPGSI